MKWFRRGPELPPLPEAPKVADLPEARLQSGGRYLGTTTDGERVTSRGLGSRGSVRMVLSDEGIDVVRLAGSFRIPVRALRGARHAGDDMVVAWQHGDSTLETSFRLTEDTAAAGGATDKQRAWVRRISKLAKKQTEYS